MKNQNIILSAGVLFAASVGCGLCQSPDGNPRAWKLYATRGLEITSAGGAAAQKIGAGVIAVQDAPNGCHFVAAVGSGEGGPSFVPSAARALCGDAAAHSHPKAGWEPLAFEYSLKIAKYFDKDSNAEVEENPRRIIIVPEYKRDKNGNPFLPGQGLVEPSAEPRANPQRK